MKKKTVFPEQKFLLTKKKYNNISVEHAVLSKT